MNKKLLLVITAQCCLSALFAQTENSQPAGWTASPYDYKVFIANNGQYTGILSKNPVSFVQGNILYSVQLGKTDAYFTKNSISYRRLDIAPIEQGKDPDETGPPKHTEHYAGSEWVNPNPDVKVEALDKQSCYYTYDVGNNQTVKTYIYKQMTYHNIYAGIDAEYSFPEDMPTEKRDGIEYTVIVHPGADLSQVQLKYTGVSGHKIDAKGNLIWTSDLGEITEHSPKAYYRGEPNNTVPVSFKVTGNVETFYVPFYDKTKTLVIDPWVGNPGFSTYNTAYEMDYDNAGNVYVYGGVGYQLVKFNNVGTRLWLFNATTLASTGPYIGGMCTDKKSQCCYLSEGWNSTGAGARSEKVNTAGVLLGTNLGNSNMNEMWRLRWEPCSHYVYGCGNGTCCPDQACAIDTNMVTETVANICAPTVVSGGYHDFGSMAYDPAGGFVFTSCSHSLVYGNVFNNFLVKCPLPALTPAAYQVPVQFAVMEWSSYTFFGNLTNGYSGMAMGSNWLYVYQGDTVKQISPVTGAINSVKMVSATPYIWGGTDADYCDNVYIGNNTNVQVYSSAWALLNTYAMTGVIYDVKANTAGSLVYACGVGFCTAVTRAAPVCVHPAACTVVLPVNLNDFTCQPGTNNGITLTWSTASETNNKGFIIDRSADGINFQTLASVPGAGSSTTTRSYSYTDEAPLNGVNYYRLSQVDYDGQTVTYNITSCDISSQTGSVYPNPSTGKFTISVDNTVSEVQIYNALGQKVYDKSLLEYSGNSIEVDLSSQTSGMYILNLIQPNQEKKIVKKLVIYPR